jgi:hypothetical protein
MKFSTTTTTAALLQMVLLLNGWSNSNNVESNTMMAFAQQLEQQGPLRGAIGQHHRMLREDAEDNGGGGGDGDGPAPCGSAACAPTLPPIPSIVSPCLALENNLNSCLLALGYDGNRIGQCQGCVKREISGYYGSCSTDGLCSDLEICHSNVNDRCHGCRTDVFALSTCLIDSVRAADGITCDPTTGLCSAPPAPVPAAPIPVPLPVPTVREMNLESMRTVIKRWSTGEARACRTTHQSVTTFAITSSMCVCVCLYVDVSCGGECIRL